MVGRWRNAMNTQLVTLFWFCVRFMLEDQSQPLLLPRLNARLHFLGGARQAVAVDARKVRKDVMGP